MAVKGDVGKIMFHNAAGTEADVSDLRAWSLSVSKDTMETTAMGATSKTFVVPHNIFYILDPSNLLLFYLLQLQ